MIKFQDAIDNKSFFLYDHSISNGNTDDAFTMADHIMEGEVYIGGQAHFYLETQSCIVTPGENGEINIISATQGPSQMQVLLIHLSMLGSTLCICVTNHTLYFPVMFVRNKRCYKSIYLCVHYPIMSIVITTDKYVLGSFKPSP